MDISRGGVLVSAFQHLWLNKLDLILVKIRSKAHHREPQGIFGVEKGLILGGLLRAGTILFIAPGPHLAYKLGETDP